MRGLKQDRSPRIIIAGHALLHSLRRGHYELGIDAPPPLRLAAALAYLASTIEMDPEERALQSSSSGPQTRQDLTRLRECL